MASGYAYSSVKTLENVMVTQSEVSESKFLGFTMVDGIRMARYRIGKKTYWQVPNYNRGATLAMFDESDVEPSDSWGGRINCSREQLIDNPPDWLRRGRQQTPSGYGRKLNSGRSIHFNGRLHRIYVICFSNSGTAYIISKGRKIIIDA